MNNDVSKSWFCVFANPQSHGYDGSPDKICTRLRDEWIEGHDKRTGAWAYCISADGLHHVHMVLEDNKAMRFSAIKKSYAIGAHFEATKGRKDQVEAYISKTPPYDEKDEQVIFIVRHGEIKGAQGERNDLKEIGKMVDAGFTPDEILSTDFRLYRFEKMIRSACLDKRRKETPIYREVHVHYLIGSTGSGKTKVFSDLAQEFGEDYVYMISDYTSGGFDKYAGERVLILDEYRGQWPYHQLLSILDRYKVQVHARYSNVFALWNEVYITSPLAPDLVYERMVPESQRETDSYQQLVRRIDDISYCFRDLDGTFQRYTIPMAEYQSYDELVNSALESVPLPADTELHTPFDEVDGG